MALNYFPLSLGLRDGAVVPLREVVVEEDLHGDLVAKASGTLRKELEQRFTRGESVDITVAMTGRLIPDESVVYDFSHDQEGLGVIMPVVKVERLDYLLTNK